MAATVIPSYNHEQWMRQALRLAERGTGTVSPNPRVGCCLVDHNVCIAEGAHEIFGGAHAEVNALRNLKSPITPTTVAYVTLEPCNHVGKTPPCTEALITSGIRHIVIAMADPNPIVSGSGIQRLTEAGITVRVGVCADDAAWINRSYRHFITTHTPYVILKTAESFDGYLAPQPMRRLQLTGPDSRRYVHQLRSEVDAVLTGISTVLIDDPRLDVRDVTGRNPQRVILDSKGRLPLDCWITRTADRVPTHLFINHEVPAEREEQLAHHGLHIHRVDHDHNGSLNLHDIFNVLASLGIASVLCETGPTLSASLLRGGHVHEWHRFISTAVLDSGYRIDWSSETPWHVQSESMIGADRLIVTCRTPL